MWYYLLILIELFKNIYILIYSTVYTFFVYIELKYYNLWIYLFTCSVVMYNIGYNSEWIISPDTIWFHCIHL